MNSPPPRRFTRLAIAIVIAAVLISTALIASDNAQRTETTTSDITSKATETVTYTTTDVQTPTGPNSTVIDSPVSDNLQLEAAIQPTSSPYGQNITIIATVLDVGSTTFQMNATELVNPVYSPCAQELVTGVNVYSGYYSSGNVSMATELQLYNPNSIYLCATMSPPPTYTFYPLTGITEVSVLTGEWSNSNSSFQPFPTGEYTVSVFDAWGQMIIGHFEVLPSQGYTYTSTSSTCSGYLSGGECYGTTATTLSS